MKYSIEIKPGTGRDLARACLLDRFILQDFLADLVAIGPELSAWPGYERFSRIDGQPRDVTYYKCDLRQAEPNVVAFWRVQGSDIEVEVLHWGERTYFDKDGQFVHLPA